ncbi:polyribonucleotide nucleotidyltransferase [candidate division WOR-3 bacterium]|nr:polyribonucleotide nucleotidyltransferase [candidate division WOR-3 bacterium]
MSIVDSLIVGDNEIRFQTGTIAKQAAGSVMVSLGGTVVLATVCSNDEAEEGLSFVPLVVDYLERTYSAGKIPGGFFKREGKPSEKEILISRLVDRPIRPLIPEGYANETQIVVMVLSHDQENDTHTLAVTGASAALAISDIPFNGPVGAVKVGLVDGQFIINPSVTQLAGSKMDVVVAGTSSAVTMIEGRLDDVEESTVYSAIEVAHREIQKIVQFQKKFAEKVGKQKRFFELSVIPKELIDEVSSRFGSFIGNLNTTPSKEERKNLKKEILDNLKDKYEEDQWWQVEKVIEDKQKELMRKMILDQEKRIDGRRLDEIRAIECKVKTLPCPHGSAIFRRGETVSLSAVTLGSKRDEQKIDHLIGEDFKRFMLHYNFPPFSVGEVRFMRGPGRREIGHGILAENSLLPVIPGEEEFPYTIRLVSDILESNGSSSMATVCASSLALMDAGIPVKKHVAGLSIGLVKEGSEYRLLTDILGDEDHMGDMDFKVAGTREGITGIQLDTKIQDLTLDIVKEGLDRAKEGRLKILDIMEKTIPAPRDSLSEFAPRVLTLEVPIEKIGRIIGPSGKTIKKIVRDSGAEVEIDDETGVVTIFGDNKLAVGQAEAMVRGAVKDVEVGEVYEGEVKKLLPFGAIVSIGGGKDGLVHISEIAHYHVNKVEDVLSVGDKLRVKVKRIGDDGKIDLSRKALISKNQNNSKENNDDKQV